MESDFYKGWENMCEQCGKKDKNGESCQLDGECDTTGFPDSGACVDKKTHKCIPPIEDCMEHFSKCMGDCHSECACQEI